MATVQELVEATESQTTAVLALNQTLRTERSRRRFTRVAVILVIILLAILCLAAWFNWRAAEEAKDIGDDNAATLEILRDSTTPGGVRYERGVDRTAAAICTVVNEGRKLHGIDIEKYPCTVPLPEKPETAPTNVYRGEDGFCVGMTEDEAKRKGLVVDPTCG